LAYSQQSRWQNYPTASPYSLYRAIFSDGNRQDVEPTVEHEPPTHGSTQKGYVLSAALKWFFVAVEPSRIAFMYAN
jgi:hypothetical protein